MNYERAISAAKSMRLRRVAMLSSMMAAAMLLAVPHLSAEAIREVLVSMHAAWIRIAAPGMQFPAGNPTSRALKIWLGSVSACYLPRLNSRSANISFA
jgi:hypothetical protein